MLSKESSQNTACSSLVCNAHPFMGCCFKAISMQQHWPCPCRLMHNEIIRPEPDGHKNTQHLYNGLCECAEILRKLRCAVSHDQMFSLSVRQPMGHCPRGTRNVGQLKIPGVSEPAALVKWLAFDRGPLPKTPLHGLSAKPMPGY